MSAVIYAAIVVIWLIVLVPMWLRRHDAALDERSSERFEGAMRVLARRSSAGPDRRYVVMPRRSAATQVHVSGAREPVKPARAQSSRVEVAAAERAPRPVKAPLSAAARRRRTLIGLLVVTAVTIVLSAAGLVPWPVQLLPELAVAGFVVHLRMQARQTAAVARHRRRVAVAPRVTPAAAPVARPVVPAAVANRMADDDAHDDRAVAEIVSDEVAGEFEAEAAAVGGETWEPTPWPRPTYAMKPPAPAVAAQPGTAPADDPEIAALDDDPEGSDLDLILEHRRAVND